MVCALFSTARWLVCMVAVEACVICFFFVYYAYYKLVVTRLIVQSLCFFHYFPSSPLPIFVRLDIESCSLALSSCKLPPKIRLCQAMVFLYLLEVISLTNICKPFVHWTLSLKSPLPRNQTVSRRMTYAALYTQAHPFRNGGSCLSALFLKFIRNGPHLEKDGDFIFSTQLATELCHTGVDIATADQVRCAQPFPVQITPLGNYLF